MNLQKPNRKKHSYVQTLVAGPEKVFPLLCPVREKDWVPGWQPGLVVTRSGVGESECVFVTPSEPEDSIWIISCHQPENYYLEMYKVAPGNTVGKLCIQLSANGADSCKAEISYEYTSLGPLGDQFLLDYTPEYYLKFMQGWEEAMNHFLTTGTLITESG